MPDNKLYDSGKNQRKVPIYKIDDLVKDNQIPVPDICKMDVQGFELEVLKGAKSIFGKTEIFILEASLFEFMPNQPILNEIIDFMYQNGYLIYDFPGFSNRPLDKALDK